MYQKQGDELYERCPRANSLSKLLSYWFSLLALFSTTVCILFNADHKCLWIIFRGSVFRGLMMINNRSVVACFHQKIVNVRFFWGNFLLFNAKKPVGVHVKVVRLGTKKLLTCSRFPCLSLTFSCHPMTWSWESSWLRQLYSRKLEILLAAVTWLERASAEWKRETVLAANSPTNWKFPTCSNRTKFIQ